MASFLQVENLTKSYGDRLLFHDITFGIEQGDKIGVVAKNGTGKTTMLKILAGVETADSGEVVYRNDLKVGYLEQLPKFNPELSVIEACLAGNSPTLRAIANYELAVESGDVDAISETSHVMDSLAAWDHVDRVNQLLSQLHIADIQQRVSTLSGGQQKRVALAKVLIEDPDLLILDEPTNHLDIDVIEWLEQYLTRSRTTLLMVTHDRYFLDRVCTRILELDMGNAYIHAGNFDYYLRRRAERIEAIENNLAKVKNTLRREQEWMRRQPQARAGKAKFRIDAFYDLKDKSRVRIDRSTVNIDVESSYIGSKIAEAKDVSKRFGDKLILDEFTYIFSRYEKVGIVGVNGVGKSTFIKILMGRMAPDSGSWDLGETVRFGYYSQEGIKFDPKKKVIDAVSEIADDIVLDGGTRLSPMQYLKKFLFEPADLQKYVHTLSGGELCRLHLAVVLMTSPNFLILDEPTNDLDIITLGLLQEYLQNFKGCMIVISHDRSFLDNVVDHLFVMQGNGVIKDFPGTYSEYKQFMAENAEAQRAESARLLDSEVKVGEKQKTERARKLSYKEKKELEALTVEIEQLEEEKKQLDAIFSSGETRNDIAEISRRYNEISELLDEKEMRWLELSEIEG